MGHARFNLRMVAVAALLALPATAEAAPPTPGAYQANDYGGGSSTTSCRRARTAA